MIGRNEAILNHIEGEGVLGCVGALITKIETRARRLTDDRCRIVDTSIVLRNVNDNFVLAELKILASHGDLRLIYLERVLLLHLNPKHALLEAWQRDYSGFKILRLPTRYRILPSDHHVCINTKPNE